MPRPFALDRLPSTIRHQLLARRTETPGLTIDDHTAWVAEQGYKVSRSSVQRYLTAHATTTNAAPELPSKATEDSSVRLGCLMVAASYALPGDKADLLNTAAELVGWVSSPTPFPSQD